MTAQTLLRLVHFKLSTAGDSGDLQDVAYDLARDMDLLGLEPMTLEEADNAKLAMRDMSARRAAVLRSTCVQASSATLTVHTPTGPVHACARHADLITSVLAHMGVCADATPAPDGATCSNCESEARAKGGAR